MTAPSEYGELGRRLDDAISDESADCVDQDGATCSFHPSERLKFLYDLKAAIEALVKRVGELEALVGTIRGLTGCAAKNVSDISVEAHSREIVGRFDALQKRVGELELALSGASMAQPVTAVISQGPEELMAERDALARDAERCRDALRGLLTEVEYAIEINEIPDSWTKWEPPDVVFTNARAAIDAAMGKGEKE